MEARIGEREAAADHEVGHAMVGSFENGWDSLRRAWIEEGNGGWGGGTTFDRLSPDANAQARVALAGTLAEGKMALQRQGRSGDLEDHTAHAHNLRQALDVLAGDDSMVGAAVEITVAGFCTNAALSRQDAAYLAPYTELQLRPLVESVSQILNTPRVWVSFQQLSNRLLNPPAHEDPDINYTQVWAAITED